MGVQCIEKLMGIYAKEGSQPGNRSQQSSGPVPTWVNKIFPRENIVKNFTRIKRHSRFSKIIDISTELHTL